MSGQRWGLYVHVPFCRTRCTYCDFNIAIGMTEADHVRYTHALIAELFGKSLPSGPLASIFFGGGTPSLVASELLVGVIDAIRERRGLDETVEITIETNPGTVDEAKLAHWRQAGVNRLSIGAQAMQDDHLRRLNRAHDVQDIVDTVRSARMAGFSNISLDAIYGLPWQTEREWRETVRRLLDFQPEHLSLYQLMIEEGTPMAKRLARGAVRLPDDDRVADMADWAEQALSAAGLMPYEISNYARTGRESVHNQLYWQLEPYLALGAGAHAYLPGRRWWNVRNVRRYMERVEAGSDPVDGEEQLSQAEEMREFLWLGLRQRCGVDVSRFRERFGKSPEAAFAEVLRSLRQSGLLWFDDHSLRLTPRGRDLASVVARALVDAPLRHQVGLSS